jgi:hypothetical protein
MVDAVGCCFGWNGYASMLRSPVIVSPFDEIRYSIEHTEPHWSENREMVATGLSCIESISVIGTAETVPAS